MAPRMAARSTRLSIACAGAAAVVGTETLSFTAGAAVAPLRSAPGQSTLAQQASRARTTSEGALLASGGSVAAGAVLLAASASRTAARRSARVARAVTGMAVTVGQKVNFKGMSGTVKHFGLVSFAAGDWVGIELDEAKGVHDGTVFGISYFQCQPKHGVFCPLADLGAAPPAPVPTGAPAQTAMPTAPAATAGPMAVGQRVDWKGTQGTVQYVGQVKFGDGEWVGVQLDAPKGMHNGTLFDITYFTCPEKMGIFTKADQLSVAGGAMPAAAPAVAAPVAAPAPVAPPAAPVPPPVAAPSGTFSIGQKVTWSNLEGTVMFCGDVKFATGEWVGIELDKAKGLHEGTIFGENYFTCKPMHGIFAPTDKVTAV
mmetsp:Transcript_3046/g.6826  ORF Transcript_3046/g.6826 Transcript_3046/m.6826 type:complete len:371 (-) Transcript_3046:68-1180(-)